MYDDAASIDYGKMLKEMQEDTVASNKERQKQGFESVTLIGWADPLSYDAAPSQAVSGEGADVQH